MRIHQSCVCQLRRVLLAAPRRAALGESHSTPPAAVAAAASIGATTAASFNAAGIASAAEHPTAGPTTAPLAKSARAITAASFATAAVRAAALSAALPAATQPLAHRTTTDRGDGRCVRPQRGGYRVRDQGGRVHPDAKQPGRRWARLGCRGAAIPRGGQGR